MVEMLFKEENDLAVKIKELVYQCAIVRGWDINDPVDSDMVWEILSGLKGIHNMHRAFYEELMRSPFYPVEEYDHMKVGVYRIPYLGTMIVRTDPNFELTDYTLFDKEGEMVGKLSREEASITG